MKIFRLLLIITALGTLEVQAQSHVTMRSWQENKLRQEINMGIEQLQNNISTQTEALILYGQLKNKIHQLPGPKEHYWMSRLKKAARIADKRISINTMKGQDPVIGPDMGKWKGLEETAHDIECVAGKDRSKCTKQDISSGKKWLKRSGAAGGVVVGATLLGLGIHKVRKTLNKTKHEGLTPEQEAEQRDLQQEYSSTYEGLIPEQEAEQKDPQQKHSLTHEQFRQLQKPDQNKTIKDFLKN